MKKIVFALITVLLITNFSHAQKRDVTIEDIWSNSTFKAESVYGLRSMNDGLHYTSLEDGKINKYAYEKEGLIETLVSETELQPKGDGKSITIDDYQFSADENKVLIATETEKIYRHSSREIYYVFDLTTKKMSKLTDDKVRYATFSPDGNYIAYVRKNNLFIANINPTAKGSSIQTSYITSDGIFNKVINGATDWVYEEEFAFDKAFFWSPDGKKIAFYRFDETNVKQFSMDIYGTLYPSQDVFKYPKTGEENAKVTIHVYDTETKKTTQLDLGDYEYIPRIKWTKSANTLSIQRMNRHQNVLDLILVNTNDYSQKVVLNETTETYVDITDNLTFLDNEKQFIWTSEKDGYNHIYLYDLKGKLVNQITQGTWDVTSYKGYDESTNTIFYISAEDSPIEKQLYTIGLEGKNKKKLTTKTGQNKAVFSKGFKYYINYHSSASTPNYVTLHDGSGKEKRVLKDNAKLVKTLEEFNISKQEFFSFKTKEGIELNAWMIKPQDFDESKKYPVLMYVYGGPGAQTVKNSWGGSNFFWYQHLASKGYIVVSVDNRGTGSRGAEFKKCTYKELGKYETIDQIASAKYLQSLKYVDGNRIGIWGWSYGGYMSSNCLFKGNDVFKMAIAVAPVTNWRYYDSIYTERYMQTPQENVNGYDDNSPINHVEKLTGKYLLVHGMADDNVHFQNTVELTEALVQANKQFDVMMYPNRNHGIYGGNTRLHLYNKMTDFVLKNL
ncbi:MAG: alpha/beta fold hydrolase [Flavobacteriales bacterium]|nr:alpha/beta fold hydrolase [Flavobacteriales bacterium]